MNDDDPEYGDAHEAMRVLADVLPRGVPTPSMMTLRRAAKRGQIRTFNLGTRRTYFHLGDVRVWGSGGSQ